ncbi:archaea-specific SMC-related protein [Salinibaculum salinum]|uniref:archaea-specific SMC-related protein n=1 Tax=Salinibaculum salinum TaxID=3131996 RepID=UPI0030EEF646
MTWTIDIENIGGILDGNATLEPGLNAVRASNWQGKSSFIQAIKTALGVSTALTEGADRGGVSLQTPDRTLSVDLVRDGSTVQQRGQPYLTEEYDIVRADLFACLDETNEIRRAVREGESLEDVLMRPLDFQNIDEQIASLRREREQVETELAQAREAKKRLPSAQERVTELESELEELREQYETLTDDETATAGDEQSTQSALAQAQSEHEQAQSQIDRLERSIDRTESRLDEKRSKLDDIEVVDTQDIEAELATARDDLQSVKRDKNVLQSVYSATEMVLSENRFDLLTEVERELTGDTVLCWTCGQETSPDAIETQLDELGEKLATLRTQTDRLRSEVERLEARREDANQASRHKRDLESEIAELEDRLADQQASIEDARERREAAAERIEELSAAVDETVEEITDIESDIKYREAELKDARGELESLQTRADRLETLEAEKETLSTEIEELRGRKDDIKYEARDAFDRAMQDILDRFDTGFETARLTSNFELIVARDGQEASLDALSEGELELLGFVAALAGYESFDVSEIVPVLLVDGVGGLADDNLRTLVEYLQGRTEYLVFTIYPEYSSFEGTEIDPGDWEVATGVRTTPD